MMNLLQWLFGLFGAKSGPPPTSDPSKDKNLIRVFDSYGREAWINRADWKKNVLPGSIQKAWNDPDQLYSLIATSLEDKFAREMIKPAERLRQLEPTSPRSATLLGVVYL